MKKRICLLLCAVFIFGLFASAAPEDGESPEQGTQELTLSYEDIESLVLSGNPTVRSNENTLKIMQSYDGMIAARNKLFTQAAKLDMSINQIITLSGGAASQNLLQLSYLSNALKAQAQQIEKPKDKDLEDLRLQLEPVNDLLVSVVQNLYLTGLSMEKQCASLKEQLYLLQRNVEVLELRLSLGQITELDLKTLQYQKTSAEAGLKNLENALVTIKGEINIQLGRSYDAPLTLAGLPEYDLTYAETVDRIADAETIKNQNFSLQVKRRELEDYDDVDDEDEKKYTTYQLERENKVLALSAAEENLRFSQEKLLIDIASKAQNITLLESECSLLSEKQQIAQTKFDMGLISEIELVQSKTELGAKEAECFTAKAEYINAVETYRWLLRGVEASASSAGQSAS